MKPTLVTLTGSLLFSTFTYASPLHSLKSRAAPTIPGYEYAGCVTEATNSRALTDHAYFDDAMTVAKCAAACTGYTFFGTEWFRECYCGNALQKGSLPAPGGEGDCNTACSGDSMEQCGGGNRLSLYSLPGAYKAPVLSTPTSYGSLGCYTEATGMRALSDRAYFDDAMTIEKCATACAEYTYWGVEYGRECYCGNTINSGSVLTDISECATNCPGNNAEKCGHGNRLNMYSFGASPTTTATSSTATTSSTSTSNPSSSGSTSSDFTALGCYTEASTGRALTGLTYFNDGMTREMCAAKCAGFKYFAMEYHQECYCGNELNAGSSPTDQSNCPYTCRGDATQNCGGDWMLQMYSFASTTSSAEPSSISTSTTSSSSSTTDSSSASTADTSATSSPSSSSSTPDSSVSTTVNTSATSTTSTTTSDASTTANASTASTSTTSSASSSDISTSTTSSSSTSSTTSSTASSTTSETATPTPNLLGNGGYEATDSSAVTWINTSGTCTNCPVLSYMVTANSDTSPHSGTQMASILYRANGYSGSFEAPFDAVAGKTYQYSVWTWAPTTAASCIYRFYILVPGVAGYQSAKDAASLNLAANRGKWVQTTATFTATVTTSMRFHYQLSCTSGVNPRTFYTDDVVISAL